MFYQLAAFVSIIYAVNAQNPWFCQSYACPSFTVENAGGYEIRNYEETKWVVTSITSSSPDPSRSERSSMFRKLFNYIRGENASGDKIDMTVPVLTKVEKQGRQYTVSMMFYLAVPNPPAPNSGSVFLVTRPAGPVYVKSFPSWFWVTNNKYRTELANMKSMIGDASLYNNDVYYKAGYNSPYDFFKRKQHEVWMDRA